MTQTAESVWDRITGTSPQIKELQEDLNEIRSYLEAVDAKNEALEKEISLTPSLSSNLELERKVEEALKEARWDDNHTLLAHNIIQAFRKNGLVIRVLPQ